MARKKWSTLGPGEERVWEAAYGAAFASEFLANRAYFASNRARLAEPSRRSSWDAAEALATAEAAGDIADMAVRELRRWRKEENQKLGHSIPLEER